MRQSARGPITKPRWTPEEIKTLWTLWPGHTVTDLPRIRASLSRHSLEAIRLMAQQEGVSRKYRKEEVTVMQAILEELQFGPKTITQLAVRVNRTRETVRSGLTRLKAARKVAVRGIRPAGSNRAPAKVWCLTGRVWDELALARHQSDQAIAALRGHQGNPFATLLLHTCTPPSPPMSSPSFVRQAPSQPTPSAAPSAFTTPTLSKLSSGASTKKGK